LAIFYEKQQDSYFYKQKPNQIEWTHGPIPPTARIIIAIKRASTLHRESVVLEKVALPERL
jgi:hypothetical protein